MFKWISRWWERWLTRAGTGAKSPSAFARAIKHARIAFAQAENLGFTPRVLDIGGGFQDNDFESTAHLIRDAILSNFPDEVTVIAEPGRFYGRGAYALVSRVISRRKQLGGAAAAGEPAMLYQSDGVYGNFMNVIMEKERMCPQLVLSKKTVEKNEKQYRYSIWGPTCDSIDCVVLEAMFECEVQVGDWLKYENMGGESNPWMRVLHTLTLRKPIPPLHPPASMASIVPMRFCMSIARRGQVNYPRNLDAISR